MKVSKKFTILLCGQFYKHSLENSYFRAFKELGLNVKKYNIFNHSIVNTFFDKDKINNFYSSYKLRKILSLKYNQNLISDFTKLNIDICFFFDLTYIFPETINFLKKRGIKTLCFLPDNPLKGFNNYRPEILKTLKEVDLYLCWGTNILNELKKKNYNNVFFHTYAWDSIRYKSYKIIKKFNNQIVFVGNWDKDRELILEDLVNKLNVKIWGEKDWILKCNSTKIKENYVGKTAYNKKFSEICYNSLINLNILRNQSLLGGGLNMRSFEIIGDEGLILQNNGTDSRKLLDESSKYLLFKTSKDLINKINHIKDNINFYKKMKKDLTHKIRKKHNYINRSKTILNIL